MVNLTVLAPDIVEAILEDKLPPDTKLFDLAVDPPTLWDDQRRRIGSTWPDQGFAISRRVPSLRKKPFSASGRKPALLQGIIAPGLGL